ncbi:hypothetical protein PEDI_15620 [Persicobacter diffluens]|uniref:HTH marR-type domain-containing protein n=1 Tax=Persicobacter diffluens TaxID=981 RepID=A0AAN4VZ39_9BACT|nr:hypothetical protein PEDI_15620 [Persicobacter diffluens]
MSNISFSHSLLFISHHFEQQILEFFKSKNIKLSYKSFLILQLVVEKEGISQHDIGQRLGLSKVQVSRLLDLLEDEAMVVRIPGNEDSREKNIYSTKVAKRNCTIWNLEIEQMLKKSLKEISPELCMKGIDFLNSWHNSLKATIS